MYVNTLTVRHTATMLMCLRRWCADGREEMLKLQYVQL
jgi:hypothetical protein